MVSKAGHLADNMSPWLRPLCPDRQTDRQTNRQTDRQTDLRVHVNIRVAHTEREQGTKSYTNCPALVRDTRESTQKDMLYLLTFEPEKDWPQEWE